MQNQQLAEKFHVDQFPTVIVLSSNGVELGRLGYIAGGPQKFAAAVNEIIFRRPSAGILHWFIPLPTTKS